jgi:hypothetical protein
MQSGGHAVALGLLDPLVEFPCLHRPAFGRVAVVVHSKVVLPFEPHRGGRGYTRVRSGPHLAVEVKALLGVLTGWDNAVVMAPRCDVCPPDLAGVRWARPAWLSCRGTRRCGGGR